jgi:hypothetical protein
MAAEQKPKKKSEKGRRQTGIPIGRRSARHREMRRRTLPTKSLSGFTCGSPVCLLKAPIGITKDDAMRVDLGPVPAVVRRDARGRIVP